MQIRRDALRTLEALVMGLFLIQSIRHLYAALYADISSADLVRRLPNSESLATIPGYIEPATVQQEIFGVVIAFIFVLAGLLIYRTRWSIPLSVAICATAREIAIEVPESSLLAAAVVVSSGFLYLSLLIIRRPRFVPLMLALGIAADQVIRAYHSTLDPTFNPAYIVSLLGLSIEIDEFLLIVSATLVLIAGINTIIEREEERLPQHEAKPDGVLTLWGGIALGGILFLELTVLGLPNAAARWAGVSYEVMYPLILMATLLPLVPEVRSQAGNFIAIFDGIYRGWLWALLLALFVIIGRRFDGVIAAAMLTAAQFFTILSIWWIVRQPENAKRLFNPTPFFVILGMGIFLLLSIGDYFTYDYAYVRPFAAPFSFISDFLSNMRELGVPLAILAGLLACMPIILERQIIPWRQGKVLETLLSLLVIVFITITTTQAAIAETVRRPLVPDCLRVASYNIHGGYTQLFAPNLERLAATIQQSGADIVLLQEVEAGLLRSGSTDQALWLANRLNMNVSFFAQDEALRGLAILSRLDISAETGAKLSSVGAQAGIQYVTYRLDDAGDLHVYNTWVGFAAATRNGQVIPQSQQDQTIQVEEIYRLVAANHFDPASTAQDRVVLGGTFNYGEDSPLYQRFAETVFEDPFLGLFREDRDTLFLIDGTSARYDYIWLLNLVPSGILIDQRSLDSDHRMSLVSVGRQSGQGCPS